MKNNFSLRRQLFDMKIRPYYYNNISLKINTPSSKIEFLIRDLVIPRKKRAFQSQQKKVFSSFSGWIASARVSDRHDDIIHNRDTEWGWAGAEQFSPRNQSLNDSVPINYQLNRKKLISSSDNFTVISSELPKFFISANDTKVENVLFCWARSFRR